MTESAEALAFAILTTPRPIAEYHEDMGPVLWWKFPLLGSKLTKPFSAGR